MGIAAGIATLLPALPCLVASQHSFGPHPASASHPLGADTGAQCTCEYPVSRRDAVLSFHAQLFTLGALIPPQTALPFSLGALHLWFHPSTVPEQTRPIIYFLFFNTPCYGRCFVASDTLFPCYMFLLQLAAPPASRVSPLVSPEREVY